MTDFEETQEHGDLREGIRRLCSKFPDAYWRDLDERHEFPWEFYDAMAAGGWIGIAIPEEYGGGGLGITEASIVLEEVAASGAAMNGCSAIHLSIFGMNPVVKYGSPELRSAYLPRVVSGELHVAFGVTEPDAGTDTTRITTRARPDGDHYVVRGHKSG
jgi:acyl-CoA dehydrogenase